MATPRKLEEKDVNKLDFTKFELEYILENANFSIDEEKIFKMITNKYRKTIINIAIELNLSESSVKRRIKNIKSKILRLL
jgi:DNA-binding NarL/FixJ family response regulator